MSLHKIEIIISNTFLRQLVELLEDTGVHGYTALDIVRGKGTKRGEHLSEGLLPTSRSSLLFTIANEELTSKIIENIQPFLDDRGGILITYKIEYASGLS
ncbi:MAG: P-II family nitrogen regulator [Ekhidna sp.]